MIRQAQRRKRQRHNEHANVLSTVPLMIFFSFFLKQQSISEACTFLRLKSSVHNTCMPFFHFVFVSV